MVTESIPSGIGKVMVFDMVAAGAAAVLVARLQDKLEETVEAITSAHDKAAWLVADMEKIDQLNELAEKNVSTSRGPAKIDGWQQAFRRE